MKNKIVFPALLLSSSVLLVACGSGGSSSSGSSAAEDRTVVGTVDGFGSVIVDGVHYESSNTEFEINDRSGVESELRVGQRVIVEGSDDGSEGVASRISYEADIRGPVESIDLAAGTLVILGQTITTDAMTVFSGTSLDTMAVGQYIEVSGSRSGDGSVLASFIELEDSTEIELRGNISGLDDTAMTFAIGGLTIDYSSVATLELDDAALANGMLVEVEGELEAGVLIASKVEQEDMHHDHDGEIKVYGAVSALDAAAGKMTVNGTSVVFNSSTRFDDGSVSDLALNAKVKVEGSFNADGALVAAEIDFEAAVKLELEGPVTAVGDGTISVMGVEAVVNTSTRVRDERDEEYYFNLSSVAVGDYVEVLLTIEADGTYRALKLEREEDDTEVKITAPVTAVDVAAGTVTMLGITVDMSSLSLIDLASLQTGTYFEVEGSYDGSVIVASEAGEDHEYDDHEDDDHEDSEEDDDSEDDDD